MTAPDRTELKEVIAGLSSHPPRISPRYFYDGEGSRLFDQITRTDEYYVTRTELAILRERGGRVAARVPAGSAFIELGTGSAHKAIELLRYLEAPQVYRPIDISREALERTTQAVRAAYPRLEVSAYWGDFAADAAYAGLPEGAARLVYYSGSTIGNFEPAEAVSFLRSLHQRLRRGDILLLAADLVKDADVIHAAYNDRAGVTAAFNRNALSSLNQRFGANFDPAVFRHLAFYNARKRRVEMHLVPERRTEVVIAGEQLCFHPDEPIHTESSYKFTPDDLQRLATQSGFTVDELVTDERAWFAEAVLRV